MLSIQPTGAILGREDLGEPRIGALAKSESFQQLTSNQLFLRLMHQPAFVNLAASASFQSLMGNSAFMRLASLSSFQSALVAGSSANLVRE